MSTKKKSLLQRLFSNEEKEKKENQDARAPTEKDKRSIQKSSSKNSFKKSHHSGSSRRHVSGVASASAPKNADTDRSKRRCRRKGSRVAVSIDTPLTWPCTPELLLEHHKHKSLLNQNEEWLLMELNEFECMLGSIEILQLMAKHSKFFEVDPPDLIEEFFEFVEEIPSYDEVVNYDVWQEFRDVKYPC